MSNNGDKSTGQTTKDKTSAFDKMEEAFWKKAGDYAIEAGIHLKEVYTPDDVRDIEYERDIGDPGCYPYTRGAYSHGYRGRLWTMREETGFGEPEDTNKRIKELVNMGTTGVNFIPDIPTLVGIDPEQHQSKLNVVTECVSLYTLQDMEGVLDEIPIEKVSVSIPSRCVAPILLCQYICIAEKRGLDISKLRVTMQNDPLVDRMVSHKIASKHLEISMRTAGDVIEFCTRNMPLAIPINVTGADRCLGLPEGMHGALGIARGLAYVDEVLKRGLGIDDFVRRVVFYWMATPQIFTEVAKVRAIRRIWAKIVKEKYHAKKSRSCAMSQMVGIATWPLTAQEPLNNIARLTLEVLTSVLAGTRAMYVPCYDEPISLPTELSHRTSLRIQQIIAYESEVVNVTDPLGGSYYVEALTNELEQQIRDYLALIEEKGGIVKALETGWLDNELDSASRRYREEIESGKRTLVGMNRFAIPSEKDAMVEVHRNPPTASKKQTEAVKKIKETRDNKKVKGALLKLREVAEKKDTTNLIPYIKEAVKSYATTSEVVGMINMAYGYHYDNFEMVSSPFD